MNWSNITTRIEKVLKRKAIAFKEIQGGYTPALRLVVTLDDDSTGFVKIGTTELTARWLRQEHTVYENLSALFMPHYLGWDDDNDQPMLILEDLQAAHWPPPWSERQVRQVTATLQEISEATLPDAPSLPANDPLTQCWANIAADPQPFLSLGLATEHWLADSLSTLLAIPYGQFITGNSLLHLDVRSDNICFVGDRVIFVDWNNACLGNPKLDLAAWLPSLAAEGGPLPETILPNSPELSAVISGYMAAHAGLPNIPDAPHVRHIQLVQAQTALPWTVRALGLPPLDGEVGRHL